MEDIFKGKKIIVTGGAGSIGSEIVKRVLKLEPGQVRVFDNNEKDLFFLKQELRGHKNLRFLIGDTRDKERLNRAMNSIDIVFHAAALKHVPLCEYNPFEAIKTNVGGTQNVIETALENDVEKVINISTDKAVNPINTMGATKLLAEKLIIAANLAKGTKKTLFSSVRFGNVIGSNGSIIDLFKRQISKGNKITITNPEMTRFVMSMHNAVGLILRAAEMMQGGEIFILKMPALKLQDLVDVIIEDNAGNRKITIEKIGVRAGEKIDESLMTPGETKTCLATEDMYVIPPSEKIGIEFDAKKFSKTESPDNNAYDSSKGELLKKDKIRQLLEDAKVT